MIAVTPQMRIWVAVEPVDFRKGIDGLVGYCRQRLQQEAFEGALFVFRNRRAQAIKLLCYDGQGFWLFQKRLSNGRFHWWPKSEKDLHGLAAHQLQLLLWNGNPAYSQVAPMWRAIQ